MARHRYLLAVVPLAFLGLFFIYPVVGMLARGFVVEGHFTPGAVLEVLGRGRTHQVLWFTLWSSGVATLGAVVLGVPIAYALHALDFRGRGLLQVAIVVPFVLPTVVVGVAFRQLFAAGGWLEGLGLDGSSGAIIAALVFFNLSVVVRTVGAMWGSLDVRREQAALVLGATPAQVFRTVTLPALRPAILAAASVVFLFCATAFGVVLTLGGLKQANIETEIWLLTAHQLDLTAAAALSVLQVLVIVGLLVATKSLERRSSGGTGRRGVGEAQSCPRAGVDLDRHRRTPFGAADGVVAGAFAAVRRPLVAAQLRRLGSPRRTLRTAGVVKLLADRSRRGTDRARAGGLSGVADQRVCRASHPGL
ncbi:MAG: ABC transporter permease subunit [Marmoricola sp.]